MFEFEFKEDNKNLICHLRGRLGADNCDKIDQAIQNKLKEINTTFAADEDLGLTMNLKEVDYIASAFIRICLSNARKLNDDKFSIINTSPMIKKTFKIAGLDEILNVS